jgi:hypothetical protein
MTRRLLALAFLAPSAAYAAGFGQTLTDTDRIAAIIKGPAAGMYTAGWLLLALGLAIGTGWEQLKVFSGQPPNHGQVVARALVAAAALGAYRPLCASVWNISVWLADSICSEQELTALGLFMKTALVQAFTALFKDNVLFAPASIIRNGVLSVFMTFMAWGVTFAVDAIRVVQVVIFNVVFMFGPIALGLHVMGFRTGQLWLTGLLEICTWNITIAIVTWTLGHRMADQLVRNAGQGAFQFDWWRDFKEVTFLATLILFVPVITSRFFGFAALGEVSKAALGADTNMAIASTLMSWGGSSSAPRMQEQSTLGDGSGRRAGD